MVEQIGNSIPAPGYTKGGSTVDDELMYALEGGYDQKGVTLKPGQGVLLLGTFIKQDPATKHYVKATGSDAEGVLRTTTDTGTTADAQKFQGNIVLAGFLKLSKVKAANSGVTLTSVLGARVNEVLGFFKF